MRREGRQHGMVRAFISSNSKSVNRLDSPPTAGLFNKVSSKPTNHSKFTGKCGRPRCYGCHDHPACKSKDKTKGNQKQRSSIVLRVVDTRSTGMRYAGASATAILDHLSRVYADDYDYDYDVDDDDRVVTSQLLIEDDSIDGHRPNLPEINFVESIDVDDDDRDSINEHLPNLSEINFVESIDVDDDDRDSIDEHLPNLSEINFVGSIDVDEINDIGNDLYHDEDWMRFCEVGFVLDQVDGDDGWCLVEELE